MTDTQIAFKLFRQRKDGTYGPLFINRQQIIEIGKTYDAEAHPTKGFKERVGWHAALTPRAPHLKEQLANGEKRVWLMVRLHGVTRYARPESQGGTWVLGDKMEVLST